MTVEEVQQQFYQVREQFQDFHFIYTDGSKSGHRTSNAIFYNGDEQIVSQIRLQNETSIFTAEQHAVLEALKLTQNKQWNKVVICTDSRSVIQSLQSKHPSSPLHIHIYNLHQTLSTNGVQIKFIWIPGHSGIHGNVQADKYARNALALTHITNIPIEYQSIKTILRQKTLRLWRKQWLEVTRATQLRRIKKDITEWQSSNRSNREEEKVLARLRLGHTWYTHSYIYKQDAQPTCNVCRTPVTVEHIIIQCPKYERERHQLRNHCNRHGLPFTLATILGDSEDGLQDLLFHFLRNIDLFTRL